MHFVKNLSEIKIQKMIKQDYLLYSNNSNKYYIFNYFNDIKINLLYFNCTNINYYYSFQFKRIKIEYNIGFYTKNNTLIQPSNLILFKKLFVICHIKIENKKKYIFSLANIDNDKYFKCIDYFYLNEKQLFGIQLIFINDENQKKYKIIYFSKENQEKAIKFIYRNDNIFNPLLIHNKYHSIVEKFKVPKIKEAYKLKKSYIKFPLCNLKRNIWPFDEEWIFKNIYNQYFCYCKGFNCQYIKISQHCKYFFYLNIIDRNRYVYKKTDFLFTDFLFADKSSDDTFPVFERMMNLKLPAHYNRKKKYF